MLDVSQCNHFLQVAALATLLAAAAAEAEQLKLSLLLTNTHHPALVSLAPARCRLRRLRPFHSAQRAADQPALARSEERSPASASLPCWARTVDGAKSRSCADEICAGSSCQAIEQ